MNRLPKEKRVQIINLLVEGCSLRSTSRLSGCSIVTVSKLLVDVGRACMDYHFSNVHGLNSERIQADEIWSFCYAKDKNVTENMAENIGGVGSAWTWVGFDPDSKMVVSWLVGDRSDECAEFFMLDLQSRLNKRVQLTTDGLKAYIDAVELTFGANVDYAQVVKIFGTKPDDKRHQYLGSEKRVIMGNPKEEKISTSLIERQNLTMRMSIRRFTRKTNGFSKKMENHILALALHYMYYNFCRIHSTIRVTPAMEARLTKDVWEISDLVDLIPEC